MVFMIFYQSRVVVAEVDNHPDLMIPPTNHPTIHAEVFLRYTHRCPQSELSICVQIPPVEDQLAPRAEELPICVEDMRARLI